MWIRMDRLERPQPGEVVRVKVQGLAVALAVANHEGRLHALEDRCPHAGALLSTGSIVDGRLVCPWHGREFELSSGRCEGYADVACFALDERADGVYVHAGPGPTGPDGTNGTT